MGWFRSPVAHRKALLLQVLLTVLFTATSGFADPPTCVLNDLQWLGRRSVKPQDFEVAGDRAYVVIANSPSLQVWDLSQPSSVSVLGTYTLSNTTPVKVRVSEGRAYVATTTGLHVYQVSDPTNIVRLGSFPAAGPNKDYVARDLVVVSNRVYEADGYHGLRILDASVPTNIVLLKIVSPPILGANFEAVQVVGSLAYVAGTEGLLLFDVSDPGQVVLRGSGSLFPPNSTGFYNRVVTDGQVAYCAFAGWGGSYLRGVASFDVSNPTNFLALDYHSTSTGADYSTYGPVVLRGRELYVVDPGGLLHFDVGSPTNIQSVCSVNAYGEIASMRVQGDTLYLADQDGFEIVRLASVAPSFTTPPLDQAVAFGSNALFSVTYQGAEPVSLQWLFETNSLVAGATHTNLLLTNVQPVQAGEYCVVAANAYGSVTSQVATLTVTLGPSIARQPASQWVSPTGEALFSVDLHGLPPFAFQWHFNGQPLTGQTDSVLFLPSVLVSDAGDYWVVVTNDHGATTSQAAVLCVGDAPFVAQSPGNQWAWPGSNAVFQVGAGGTPPFAYQWFFNDAEVPGATNATLTLSNVQVQQRGLYRARISTVCGATLSSAAELAIIGDTNILLPRLGVFGFLSPSAVQVIGQRAYVTTSSMQNDLSKRPGFHILDVSDPSNIVRLGGYDSGLDPLETADAVRVVGNRAYVLFRRAGLTILDVTDPAHVVWLGSAPYGGLDLQVEGNLAFIASGGPGLTIFDVSDPTRIVPVSSCVTGGTANAVKLVGNRAYVAGGNVGLVVLDVSNPTNVASLGSYTTRECLNVDVAGSVAYVADSIDQLLVLDVSDPINIVQLQRYFYGPAMYRAATDVAVRGRQMFLLDQSHGVYSFDATDPANVVTNGHADAVGFTRHFQVLGRNVYVASPEGLVVFGILGVGPEITDPPQDQLAVVGADATFAVAARGAEPFSYQWYFDGNNVLPGATNATLTLTNVRPAQVGRYSAVVANAYGAATSHEAMLSLSGLPPNLVQWTNPAGGSWQVAANWTPNRVPASNDWAVIAANGDYTVTISTAAEVDLLTLGGADGTACLALSGGSLTVSTWALVETNGLFRMTDGTMQGSGSVGVQGTLDWSGGGLNVSGLKVFPVGLVNLGGSLQRTIPGTVINQGAVNHAVSNTVYISGVLDNDESGVLNLSMDRGFSQSGSGILVSRGMIRKTAGSGTSLFQVPVFNSGRVVSETNTIAFGEDSVFSTGTVFEGDGQVRLSSGTVTLEGSLQTSNLNLDGANLLGMATLHGTWTWTSGNIASSALLTSMGELWIDGNLQRSLAGSLTNQGQIIWTVPNTLSVSGQIVNESGGIFEARNNATLAQQGTLGRFINHGLILKSAGNGNTVFSLPVVNTGVIECRTNTIRFAGDNWFATGTDFRGAGGCALVAGTSTFSGEVTSENLALDGASLAGTATVRGSWAWMSGNIVSNALLVSSGELWIGGNLQRSLAGSLTNLGQIIWTVPNTLSVSGQIVNEPGGIFEARNSATLAQQGTLGRFINHGLILKSAGNGSSTFGLRVINTGAIECRTNTIRFASDAMFEDGTWFRGQGITELVVGTSTFSGQVYTENLSLNGATIAGTAGFDGAWEWLSGDWDETAQITVLPGAQLTVGGAYQRSLAGSLANRGSIVWTVENTVFLGGLVQNTAEGTWDFRNSQQLAPAPNSAPLFINEGLLRRSTVADDFSVMVPFQNSGSIEALLGRLAFTQSYSDQGGSINLLGGAFRASQPLALSRGWLRGYGDLLADVDSGSTLQVVGTNGVMRIVGDYTQSLEGGVEFDIAGPEAGVSHGRLDITGAAKLDGSIAVRWVDGYVPEVGAVFQVMTFNHGEGQFRCRSGMFLLGYDRRLEVVVGDTDVKLVCVAAPDPTGPSLSIIKTGGVILCWPAEFDYLLESSTNLNQTNWTRESLMFTNRWMEDLSAPSKFYRLRRE